MNDFDQSFLEFQRAEQARRSAEAWLAAFEAALVSRDPASIGSLFHEDCHWRDILTFTWHLTSVAGRDKVAARLAAEQQRTAATASICLPAAGHPAMSSGWASTASRLFLSFKPRMDAGPVSSAFLPMPLALPRRGFFPRRWRRWKGMRRRSVPIGRRVQRIRETLAATTGQTCAARRRRTRTGNRRFW